MARIKRGHGPMGLPVGKVGFRALCWLRRRTDLRMDADAGLAGGGGGGGAQLALHGQGNDAPPSRPLLRSAQTNSIPDALRDTCQDDSCTGARKGKSADVGPWTIAAVRAEVGCRPGHGETASRMRSEHHRCGLGDEHVVACSIGGMSPASFDQWGPAHTLHSQQVQPPLIGANISPRYRARVKSQASWASKALVASWSHSVKPPSPLAADKFTPDFCHRRQPAGPIGDSLSSPTHLLPLPTLVFTPYCEAPFRQSVHLGFPVVPAICSLVAGLALLGCASRWRSEHEAAMLNPTPTVRELACVDGTSPAILPVALGPLGQIPARYPGFSKGSTVSSRASIRRSVSLPWGHIRYIVRIGATLKRSREPDGWQLKS
ncbi:hypothetical protein Purlil1_3980 [Purpureocillium lilacinum]|uniref:Uncharacterized protein n=1 Tax=Purpureocillium lilacinum TaxID=33203 RepID=A0ABR0C5Q2_PURLI|nr:hypothetical protein Purlil1_3980 [Purpureocillium lilacinum]